MAHLGQETIKPAKFRKPSGFLTRRGGYQPHLQTLSSRQLEPKSWESTCVRDLFYDPESEVLVIEFMKRGIYAYFEFEPWAFAEFNAAGSRGQFFNLYIRDRYDFEKIG